jgi:hypothetical protein
MTEPKTTHSVMAVQQTQQNTARSISAAAKNSFAARKASRLAVFL